MSACSVTHQDHLRGKLRCQSGSLPEIGTDAEMPHQPWHTYGRAIFGFADSAQRG
jgi:hypothetical protein